MSTHSTGPSGGVLGRLDQQQWAPGFVQAHPDIVRTYITIGRHQRAGHDRARWEGIDWDAYRARVGILQRRGPWSVEAVECLPDSIDRWTCEAEDMPFVPGWYTALRHEERGLVMSDLPAEIAGCLPFLDRADAHYAATLNRPRILVSGLGLGIVPARLLAYAEVERVDVVELDPDVIELVTGDAEAGAPNAWAADPRLHIHHSDAHTWWPTTHHGCALHDDCRMSRWAYWDAAWHDIWDTVSPANLPSMIRLHRHYGRAVGWQRSWERPECEAMRRRSQTVERPPTTVIEDAVNGGSSC